MKDRLTEKEKQELRKLLEDQDKPADSSWLMLDFYAKLSKKQNPFNLSCSLCMKTHLAKDCPNKNKKEPKYTYSYYNYDANGD